jgi:integrase
MRLADRSDGRKLPRKVALTKRFIAGLTCPPSQRSIVVYDANVRGLCIVVTGTTRTFFLYRKWRGRPLKMSIGVFPELTVENARKLTLKHLNDMAHGIDPRDERRSIRLSITLDQLFQRWQKEHAKPRHTPRTITTDKSRFDTCFADWKTKKIATIREADVRAKHASLAESRGQTTANRAVQLLRRLLNHARVNPNPAGNRAVNFYPERSRERFLQPGELPKFFAALDQELNGTLKDLFLAALWTGQRRSNVAAMRWDELDLDRKTWTIPSTKTKNHEPQLVHLAAPSVELLTRRQSERDERVSKGDNRFARGYVFPSCRRDAKCPHVTEPKGAWKRLLDRAGLKDLRMHDLRRSLGSWAAMTGASTLVIGKTLGHLDPAATAIYARLHLDPVRASVDAAAQAILTTSATEAAKQEAEKKKASTGS